MLHSKGLWVIFTPPLRISEDIMNEIVLAAWGWRQKLPSHLPVQVLTRQQETQYLLVNMTQAPKHLVIQLVHISPLGLNQFHH